MNSRRLIQICRAGSGEAYRDPQSPTMTVPLLTLMVLIVAFGAEPAAGDIG
jgi:hypothetical protein